MARARDCRGGAHAAGLGERLDKTLLARLGEFHLSHRMGLRRTSTDRLESGARRSMSALPSVLLEGEAISWIVSSMDGLGFLPPMPTDPAVSERLQAGSVSVKTRRRISVVIM